MYGSGESAVNVLIATTVKSLCNDTTIKSRYGDLIEVSGDFPFTRYSVHMQCLTRAPGMLGYGTCAQQSTLHLSQSTPIP